MAIIPEHNFIVVSNGEGECVWREPERNGWLILEALLEKIVNDTDRFILFYGIERFGWWYRGLVRCGWWEPDRMLKGVEYPKIVGRVRLTWDIDDTAWFHMCVGRKIDLAVISNFLYPGCFSDLSVEFQRAIQRAGVNPDLLIRTFSKESGWSEDMDIVCISAALAAADDGFKKSGVFEENALFLDYILENENVSSFFRYYEPVEFGYALMILWDRVGGGFLSVNAREKLYRLVKEGESRIRDIPLCSRWGGGEDRIGGHLISAFNERIGGLLLKSIL